MFEKLSDLDLVYDDFHTWYHDIVLKELLDSVGDKRDILLGISVEGEYVTLAGIVIVKKTLTERKICTFRILQKYRRSNLAELIFRECFIYLETDKPLMTVSETDNAYFEKYIQKYGFKLTQQLRNYYKQEVVEFVYNGVLEL